MSDPSLAIQIALIARIDALASELASRVYDDVPPEKSRVAKTGAAFPYVAIGDGQVVPIDEDCFDRSNTFFTIKVSSRAVGWPEVKTIAGDIRLGLHEEDLQIVGHVLDRMRVESINYLRDPDGMTRRAIIELSVETQPAT